MNSSRPCLSLKCGCCCQRYLLIYWMLQAVPNLAIMQQSFGSAAAAGSSPSTAAAMTSSTASSRSLACAAATAALRRAAQQHETPFSSNRPSLAWWENALVDKCWSDIDFPSLLHGFCARQLEHHQLETGQIMGAQPRSDNLAGLLDDGVALPDDAVLVSRPA